MITLPAGTRVWLAGGFTDMRKGFDGLAMLVQEKLERDPFGGQIFVIQAGRTLFTTSANCYAVLSDSFVSTTTGVAPMSLLPDERAVMLPAPALKAPLSVARRVAMPIESLQHPLSVYDELLSVAS